MGAGKRHEPNLLAVEVEAHLLHEGQAWQRIVREFVEQERPAAQSGSQRGVPDDQGAWPERGVAAEVFHVGMSVDDDPGNARREAGERRPEIFA